MRCTRATQSAGLAISVLVGRVFGEVQASVNFIGLNSGWSGFVRGDLRFGEDLFGGSGKAGIRYTW